MLTTARRHFAILHNLHQAPILYAKDKKYTIDYDLEEYPVQIQAFLSRRWMTKREVPPKVEILKT